ncbi:hypothetical protein DESUT3_12370 [Desulfuromonas versatilis]|uniref:Cell division protein ZapB n=1 Tax=Desulfuromonas versatilis TaxID=2802975 RepID=A0ABM8HTY9_9BACT|nr:cell division protein ZapB [Desulfuromonas versatilis]BCR04168.1 hypothetical protein DESUT3_12370 [Desulfuromonas versatilis]
MDLNIIARLEQKVDQLLERKLQLEADCRRLREENSALVQEQERFRAELDRIIDKLDRLEQEPS